MQQILHRLQKDPRFQVLKINLEILKEAKDVGYILDTITWYIGQGLNKNFTGINDPKQFQEIFNRNNLDKPLILILDEFDSRRFFNYLGPLIPSFDAMEDAVDKENLCAGVKEFQRYVCA